MTGRTHLYQHCQRLSETKIVRPAGQLGFRNRRDYLDHSRLVGDDALETCQQKGPHLHARNAHEDPAETTPRGGL